MKTICSLVIAMLLVGCASNVLTRYPDRADAAVGRGRLIVKLSSPMHDVSVTVDGKIVAEDAFTEHVTIENVPTGRHVVVVVASGQYRTNALEVERPVMISDQEDEVVLIGTPPISTGYYIYQAVTYAALIALIAHNSRHWR
jgi:hypothetical protein